MPVIGPPRPWRWLVAAGLGVLVGVAIGAMIPAVSSHQAHGYRVGDCVVVEPTSGGELHTTRTGCDTDPSFTVAKLADRAGDCAANGYDRFRPPIADAATAKLCLVPNLVAGHCYRLGTAVGVWDLSNCADRGPTTIKVSSRLETDNAQACSSDGYLPARTYPSPPRTYCLAGIT
ncbi:hypothetical protein A5707_16115 [Mycobacterium kyorinense]|uniref:Pyridine nucleotide-disulfide oxidoreductase n=2 Tax=Mycobacterium kyorinense TaxID=487514 RepID=A0A1A2ZHM5_9MYCO|nr:hypothetical protein A5707_16115 [Mycobacterium kyorinense]